MKYIRLFPVYGFYIGRTTLEELQSGLTVRMPRHHPAMSFSIA
jgi:hypothetical protein